MGRFISVSFGLLVVFLSLSGVKGCCCPTDWLPRNGYCYKVFDDQKNWNDAEMFCRKHKPGCHLASLHSTDDSADVAEYISDYLKSGSNVWIGLNDPKKQRVWQWTDRSRTSHLTWNPGEPNNSRNNESCVELWNPSGQEPPSPTAFLLPLEEDPQEASAGPEAIPAVPNCQFPLP